jgi:hypothetical protein
MFAQPSALVFPLVRGLLRRLQPQLATTQNYQDSRLIPQVCPLTHLRFHVLFHQEHPQLVLMVQRQSRFPSLVLMFLF